MQKLYKSLGIFRSKIESVKKDADNPFFKSKYADLASILDAIKKPMEESGLALTHRAIKVEGSYELCTTLSDVESGESIESLFPIFGNKPQEIGSSMTYARRYNIQALLDIPTEDDDGNGANNADKTQKSEHTGGKTEKWMNQKELELCISEGFGHSKEAIKQWAEDFGYKIGKPMQEVILTYLDTGEIKKPNFVKG